MISERYSNNAFKNEIEKNTKDTSCYSMRVWTDFGLGLGLGP